MKTLQFKTNIKCSGCVAAVTPFLEAEKTIEQWQVETANPSKILTVQGEIINEDQVITAVKKAGYSIEPVK